MEPLTLLLVAAIGFIAAFIGTNVGGGGLIVIPALIMLGLPPKTAIATMRVGSVGLLTGGIYSFSKGNKIDYRVGLPASVLALVGAYLGATTLLRLPDELVGRLVGLFIIGVLAFVIANRHIGVEKPRKPGRFSRLLGYASYLFLGFWGGIFVGGTGIFAAYALIFLFGQTFLEAAGTRKIPAVAMAAVSLIVFALGGIVDWVTGAVLAGSMLLGSYLGASYGMKKGDRWVRLLFIVFVLLSAAKLLFW
jgi:uncharacterized membrane protein YfcA